MLQRGRAHMSAESNREHFGEVFLALASTGPRSHERGEKPPRFTTEFGKIASTGPRSHERGEVRHRLGHGTLEAWLQRGRAHMSAESATGFDIVIVVLVRFNGAALT